MRARVLLLASLLLPAPALADRTFVLPSTTMLAGENNIVTFDAAGSDTVFQFDHRPIALESIAVTRPDGTPGEPVNALRQRFRSVFDVRLDQPGTWKVASRQTMVSGSFMLNGEERRVGGRGGPPPGAGAPPPGGGDRDGPRGAGAPGQPRRQPPVAVSDIPADATDVHLTETASTTETFVTQGAPSGTVLKPTGQGLELDPITHPNAVAAGEMARFRFLLDGKPAAGIKVTVVPGGGRYREDPGILALVAGADGVVAVRWPAAGLYWVGAEAEDAHPAEPRAEKRRLLYAATLEVMTP